MYVRRLTSDSTLWSHAQPFLRSLDIELTHRCNFDCIHCCVNKPLSDERSRSEELSTKELVHILDQAAALGCLYVRFTGGEPLIRPDFADLYRHARSIGLRVMLFTNASALTPDLVRLLERIPPLAPVEVSMYGMEPESCEAVTGRKGSFEAVSRGVSLLREHRIPFVVKGALLPPTRNEVHAFDDWAKTQVPGMENPPSLAVFLDLRWNRDDEAKNDRIRALRPDPEGAMAVIARHEPEFSRDMRTFCASFAFPPGDRLFTCGAGKTQAAVDPTGRLMMCQAFRHPEAVFSLRHGSLKEGMHSFFPRIRERRAQNPDYMRRCARCFLKGLCEMCPGKAWSESGTFDVPVEFHCEVAHAQGRYLGYLARDERAWEIRDWQGRLRVVNAGKGKSQ